MPAPYKRCQTPPHAMPQNRETALASEHATKVYGYVQTLRRSATGWVLSNSMLNVQCRTFDVQHRDYLTAEITNWGLPFQ